MGGCKGAGACVIKNVAPLTAGSDESSLFVVLEAILCSPSKPFCCGLPGGTALDRRKETDFDLRLIKADAGATEPGFGMRASVGTAAASTTFAAEAEAVAVASSSSLWVSGLGAPTAGPEFTSSS